ncbi:UNVERIFIED_CONTAM: hypothetical protein Sradi_3837700 [Sesamum radiatum]|uniref:Uncharacterized protein n=1 Tax=Sesamum radiatum TaxID=300843 RepID=A0AAW2Q1E6_SESRA
MRARREKNLCYNCDEVFVLGHKCKMRYSYVLMNDEDIQVKRKESKRRNKLRELKWRMLHFPSNAMKGNISTGTLRVKGVINGKEIHILMDSESTHSFIDEKVVKALGIKTEPTTPMLVSVADGYGMMSTTICHKLSWEVQSFQFSYPVRTLKLGGCDFVLGCDWLGDHNPIELDFHQLTVTISQQDGKVILRALPHKSSSISAALSLLVELLRKRKVMD